MLILPAGRGPSKFNLYWPVPRPFAVLPFANPVGPVSHRAELFIINPVGPVPPPGGVIHHQRVGRVHSPGALILVPAWVCPVPNRALHLNVSKPVRTNPLCRDPARLRAELSPRFLLSFAPSPLATTPGFAHLPSGSRAGALPPRANNPCPPANVSTLHQHNWHHHAPHGR